MKGNHRASLAPLEFTVAFHEQPRLDFPDGSRIDTTPTLMYHDSFKRDLWTKEVCESAQYINILKHNKRGGALQLTRGRGPGSIVVYYF